MKKLLVIFCSTVLLQFAVSAVSSSAPVPGTYTGSIYDGFVYVIDDPQDQIANIDDEAKARQDGGGPGLWDYWAMQYLLRDTISFGDWNYTSDTSAWRTFDTTRSRGTFYLKGDNLWGDAPGTLYFVNISGEASTIQHLTREYDPGTDTYSAWESTSFEGSLHWWGEFTGYQYSLDFTADLYIDQYFLNTYLDPDAWNWKGTLTNVEFTVAPVPEPATMFLLGSGLIGLAGFRRKWATRGRSS